MFTLGKPRENIGSFLIFFFSLWEFRCGLKATLLLQGFDVDHQRLHLLVVEDALVDGHAGFARDRAFGDLRAGGEDGFAKPIFVCNDRFPGADDLAFATEKVHPRGAAFSCHRAIGGVAGQTTELRIKNGSFFCRGIGRSLGYQGAHGGQIHFVVGKSVFDQVEVAQEMGGQEGLVFDGRLVSSCYVVAHFKLHHFAHVRNAEEDAAFVFGQFR